MRNQTVLLHFPQSQAAFLCLALCRLPREQCNRAARPCLHLVRNLIFELYVIHISDKDSYFVLPACPAINHGFSAVIAEAQVNKLLPYVRDRLVLVAGAIDSPSRQCAELACKRLNQMADSHPPWQAVRAEQNIRDNS